MSDNPSAFLIKVSDGAKLPSYTTVAGMHQVSREDGLVVCANGKKTYLGIFADEIAAAHAYDTAARTHFKEFARPNFTECTTDD